MSKPNEMLVHEVVLNDIGFEYKEFLAYYTSAKRWAKSNCVSYVKSDVIDVSDVSMTMDLIASFLFNDEKDVVMFTLKWKK